MNRTSSIWSQDFPSPIFILSIYFQTSSLDWPGFTHSVPKALPHGRLLISVSQMLELEVCVHAQLVLLPLKGRESGEGVAKNSLSEIEDLQRWKESRDSQRDDKNTFSRFSSSLPLQNDFRVDSTTPQLHETVCWYSLGRWLRQVSPLYFKGC